MAFKDVESDRVCVERSCERLKQLTKLEFQLITSDNHIVLISGGQAAGYWTKWHDAKLSLASSVQIVDDAFLEIVLFGDNSKSMRRISEIELELVDAKEIMAIQALELKIMKRAVRRFTKESENVGLPPKDGGSCE